MASMGSFPGGLDIPVLLNSASYRKPMIPLLAYKTRKCVEAGVFADRCRAEVPRSSRKEFCNRFALLNGFSITRRRGGMKQCINATGEGSGGGETGEGSVDPLLATIEKGEKVLEIQRGLLQQIAERKKLVSSIKSSIIDLESNEPPSLVSDVPAPRIGAAADTRATPGKTFPGNGASFDVSPQEQLKTTTSWDARSTGVTSWSPKSFPAPSPKPSSETSINEDSNKYTKDKSFSSVILSDMPLSTEDEKYKQSKETNPRDVNADVQEPAKEDVKPPPLAGANVMNIILVAAECSPWIKTGGLGDVVGALPKALARRGHRVMVVVPRYREYAETQDLGVKKIYKVQNQDMEVTYFHTFIDGVDFVFINSPEFRNTGTDIYGGNRMDILRRIVLFCKAAVEVPWHVPCGGICYGDGNLVFIANDWHTALLPVYLKAYYRDNGLMKYTRSVLVIHNIAHQGRGPVDDFRYVDLPPHYLDHFKLYDPVGGDHFNIFAAGLKTADRIVTVSHGYAWELKTVEGGWGLQGIINENDWKLRGIVNGIDTKDWSPECDIYLQSDGYVNYSLDTLKTGKAQCKAALQKELHLPVRDDIPLIGFVGRLDHQKGVDLIAEAVPWMMSQGVQLVMLGTGRDDLEEMLLSFEAQYKDKVKGWVGFSVKTAHRITAGADILLMPSRFEPCGLNQMYAMHYGTIPVVHSVGGLRDTVAPFNPYEETGFGWTFPTADAHELIDALRNCLLTYREYKQSWEGLQRRGMVQDLSWDNAALNYEEVLVAAKYQW